MWHERGWAYNGRARYTGRIRSNLCPRVRSEYSGHAGRTAPDLVFIHLDWKRVLPVLLAGCLRMFLVVPFVVGMKMGFHSFSSSFSLCHAADRTLLAHDMLASCLHPLLLPLATPLCRTVFMDAGPVAAERGTPHGRLSFWDDTYAAEESFSWYCGWQDMRPFWEELVPGSARVLVPGIGNDAAMVELYDAMPEPRRMSAFDYSPQGVERARQLFADRPVDLRLADAKDLPWRADEFDAVLDKGVLDAVYLSGGYDAQERDHELQRAVDELHGVVRPGGIVVSVTAAAAAHLPRAFSKRPAAWQTAAWADGSLVDGTFHITDDGYGTNNVDATILAWERLS